VYFTVRVELHGADSKDYDKLHEEMAKDKFFRIVLSTDGLFYDLPTAEYNYISTDLIDSVLVLARISAGRVGKPYSILVTKADERVWHNLKLTSP